MRALYTWIAAVGLLAGTACRAGTLLSEGFDDVSGLAAAGWTFLNRSASPNEPWFQGNSGIFAAQSGAPDAYIAANFASSNDGAILNLIVTPALTLSGGEVLSFHTRADAIDGLAFDDNLAVLLGRRPGSDWLFDAPLTTIGPSLSGTAYPASWQRFIAIIPKQAGPTSLFIGFAYVSGNALDANYIGLDSVVVSVPEPSVSALLGLGLAALALARRRRGRPAQGRPQGSGRLRHSGFAAALALAAVPAVAVEPEASSIVRDPATGQLRAPTHEEFRAMQERERAGRAAVLRSRVLVVAAPRAAADAVEEKLPGGGVRVRLGDRAMTYSVVSRNADGSLGRLQCLPGEAAAEAAVTGPTLGATVLTREPARELR